MDFYISNRTHPLQPPIALIRDCTLEDACARGMAMNEPVAIMPNPWDWISADQECAGLEE